MSHATFVMFQVKNLDVGDYFTQSSPSTSHRMLIDTLILLENVMIYF